MIEFEKFFFELGSVLDYHKDINYLINSIVKFKEENKPCVLKSILVINAAVPMDYKSTYIHIELQYKFRFFNEKDDKYYYSHAYLRQRDEEVFFPSERFTKEIIESIINEVKFISKQNKATRILYK